MPDEELLRKLNVRPGTSIKLINTPDSLTTSLTVLSDTISAVLLFAYTSGSLRDNLPCVVRDNPPPLLLWIAFPKKTSSLSADLTRDVGWDILATLGYRTVNLIAIDQDWSAFRIQPVSSKATIPKPISMEGRPELIIPPDLLQLLSENEDSLAFFNGLSYTCRKEYINWIEGAKRQETRIKRIHSALEMLNQKVKSPTR